MPGINNTGAPRTEDIVLGRGRLLFAENDGVTGLPVASGLRDLGNVSEFTITVNTEDFRHQSSRDCVKQTDKRFIVSQESELSFVAEEINYQNLAAFFSGDTSTYNNPHDVTHTDTTITDTLVKGNWYELRDGSNARVYNLDAAGVVYTVEEGPAPGTPLVAGTDYEVDEQLGLIRFLPTGVTLVDGDEVIWSISTGASTPQDLDQVEVLTRDSLSGTLIFEQNNAGDCGQRSEFRFHSVDLSADGDLSGIGDEPVNLPFTGVAGINSALLASDPTIGSGVATVRTYDMV